MSSDEQPFSDLEATLKKTAGALRQANVPFLLGGSLASWARGGPESRHDLDLMIKHEDAERALSALEAAGMRAETPPEEWLVKAWDGDVLVDCRSPARCASRSTGSTCARPRRSRPSRARSSCSWRGSA
jgi:hypothetical protein